MNNVNKGKAPVIPDRCYNVAGGPPHYAYLTVWLMYPAQKSWFPINEYIRPSGVEIEDAKPRRPEVERLSSKRSHVI